MDAESQISMLLHLEEEDEEDEEEEEVILDLVKDRKCTSDIFKTRESEGVLKILINNHLFDDEVRFKQYFRLTKNEFYDLYQEIKDVEELKSHVYNRNATPISGNMKLALTLRYVYRNNFNISIVSK